MFNIQEELKKLPHDPGVYIMHDADDTVIYVGKAKDLHNRVRSYFRKITGRGPQIDKMVSLIDRFEYIITDSELEALVLENNLIKEYSPKYNTMLKDDKTYPYIKITLGEDFPRITLVRQMKKDRSRYFGPYSSAYAVNNTIELVNKIFMLRTCTRSLPKEAGQGRPCLNQHIGRCCAPCTGNVSKEEYAKRIDSAIRFLNGEYGDTLKELKEKMTQLSENMEYEEAAKIRDIYDSVLFISEKQKITAYDEDDRDIIALAANENDAVVQVFFVRTGKLIGREHFHMKNVEGVQRREILGDFIKQFYAGTPYIPKELMLEEEIDDLEVIEGFLTKKRGSKTVITIPKIGKKEKLVELASKNAQLILDKDMEEIKRQEARTLGAVKEIADLIDIPSISRMEAFDISNISGFMNVGSMVVFEKGKPKKSDYRKFRIKTVAGPDDYACMREVLTRRFLHGMEDRNKIENNLTDDEYGSFSRFPDLLLMDGGKGQVNIALEVLSELGIDIPVCGMVKDDDHNTRGLYYNNRELPMDKRSEGFKLITRIQDEAHRFAIEYHRSLRTRSQTHSVLEDIPGVGSSRRKALMRAFQSIEEIANASVEELSKIDEIPAGTARDIYNFFHKEEKR
ncbi:MAG: excinuclease ABC subunit UvrC [Lachnospiraceae bacterium]|nr:excinuclease ABC subunit UvrC [Lachnospiraceae bacterium]